MEGYKKSWWMWIVIIIFGLYTILELGLIWGIIAFGIWIACSNKCVEWSTKINKNKNFAFFIGLILGLLGLLGYWIYCRKKLKIGGK